MDGCSWLERNVIGDGVYLLIDNDSGGGVGYLHLSQRSVVKPDSDNESGGKKGGRGCQGGG